MMILELELQMKSGFACSAFENETDDQDAEKLSRERRALVLTSYVAGKLGRIAECRASSVDASASALSGRSIARGYRDKTI
jgi:hypothetical protein